MRVRRRDRGAAQRIRCKCTICDQAALQGGSYFFRYSTCSTTPIVPTHTAPTTHSECLPTPHTKSQHLRRDIAQHERCRLAAGSCSGSKPSSVEERDKHVECCRAASTETWWREPCARRCRITLLLQGRRSVLTGSMAQRESHCLCARRATRLIARNPTRFAQYDLKGSSTGDSSRCHGCNAITHCLQGLCRRCR